MTDRLDAALDERRTVLAALENAGRHTAEGRPRSLTPDAATWRKILSQLDTEITTLMRADLVHHFDGQLRQPAYRATGSRMSHRRPAHSWCAWEAGGAEGEPPLLKPASPGWERMTGTGEVSGNARDELHLELDGKANLRHGVSARFRLISFR